MQLLPCRRFRDISRQLHPKAIWRMRRCPRVKAPQSPPLIRRWMIVICGELGARADTPCATCSKSPVGPW